MGFIKQLNGGDPQNFPGAAFAAAGTVPLAQCTQALMHADDAWSLSVPFKLFSTGTFEGHDLTGKICHITASVGGNTGDFTITFNTASAIDLASSPGDGNPVSFYISNGGGLQVQQDIWSLFSALDELGYACTIKGGILYTNAPNAVMANQCLITWSPLS